MSYYPDIQPGDTVTADVLRSMMPQLIYKPAHTDRPSTTTMTDDPDFIVPLEANGVYKVSMHMMMSALPAAGFQTQWRVPSGATGTRSAVGPGTGTTVGTSGDVTGMHVGVHGYGTTINYGGRTSAGFLSWALEESVVIMGATAGTLALQWAQNTSNATYSRLAQGSFMEVRRLA